MSVVQRCDFFIGDRIDHQFQVQKILGEGSFGKVYAVTDPNGELYALKLLKLWEVPSEIRASLMARFDMEFETGRIDSNYLVHSIAHGAVSGNPYIVMEYCPNGDLLSVMAQQYVDLSKVATHVLYGLKALHSCGKVHRDLKPENVLVKKNGDYALTDFGISGDRNKRMTERNILGKPKQIFGTYAYMPPEQLNPRKDATVLPTTDIFSFGVMMYQLITNCLPFGQLVLERDLVSYLRRGKNGDWDKDSLLSAPSGKEWYQLIDGCLIPNLRISRQGLSMVFCSVSCRERNSAGYISWMTCSAENLPSYVWDGWMKVYTTISLSGKKTAVIYPASIVRWNWIMILVPGLSGMDNGIDMKPADGGNRRTVLM